MTVNEYGAIVYANQNKDLAARHPNGQWIITGVEMWVVPADLTRPARRVTTFNGTVDKRFLAYPTTADSKRHTVYLTLVPGGKGGANPPGEIYQVTLSGK